MPTTCTLDALLALLVILKKLFYSTKHDQTLKVTAELIRTMVPLYWYFLCVINLCKKNIMLGDQHKQMFKNIAYEQLKR